MLKYILQRLQHYAHAIARRALILHQYLSAVELKRIKKCGQVLSILKNPHSKEDIIDLSRFVHFDDLITLIDVGANTGYWSEEFITFFPNTRVIAFEADPEVASDCKKNLQKYDSEVYPMGLSDTHKHSSFNRCNQSILSSLEKYEDEISDREIDGSGKIQVELRPLDSFKIEKDKQVKTVLKIDVQGHEIEVLFGAKETLNIIDVVILELSFAHQFKNRIPSFSRACSILEASELYPVIFQDYGKKITPYAYERDVIFVKRVLINNIMGW